MQIIAHRGYWKKEDEKNTLKAFKRAFDYNFGIEVDIRDYDNKIVISHDMATSNSPLFEDLVKISNNNMLALNIKSDGISDKIKEILKKYNHKNYFCFDMSIAEMVQYNKKNLIFYTGLSDILKNPPLIEEAKGIWLDSFYEDWFNKKDIEKILSKNKAICIVSPELHKRNYEKVWQKYKNIDNIALCTDFPDIAKEFFK